MVIWSCSCLKMMNAWDSNTAEVPESSGTASFSLHLSVMSADAGNRAGSMQICFMEKKKKNGKGDI